MGKKREDLNWRKIKSEYITTNTTAGKLAKKYGAAKSTIQNRVKSEGWDELRSEVEEKSRPQLVEKLADKKSTDISNIAQLKSEIEMLSLQLARDSLAALVKTAHTRTIESCDDGRSLMRDMRTVVDTYKTVVSVLGLDEASALARERLAMDKAKQGTEEDIDAHNEQFVSIAEIISNPQPNRTMEDIEGEAGSDD